jgi:NitT/TauT family transport system substrate-binding protein
MQKIKMLAVFGLLAVFATFAVGGISQPELIPVVFQSKWFPQAQFAGYWAAGGHLPGESASGNVPLENGLNFYAEEGLDVTILDGGSANPSQNVAAGNADFGTDWIANMLVQRQAGLDLIHIGQMFQLAGYLFVALESSGIDAVEDFAGRNVGVWAFGNEFVAEACIADAGLSSDLDPTVSDPDVNTTVYAFDPSLVFPDEVDVASAMVYNELDQIQGLGFGFNQLSIISAAAAGCGLLEDFIFTTAELLASDNWTTAAGVESGMSGQELAERFVRASVKGWEWAINNQAEAVSVVIDFCGDTCNGSGSTQTPTIHQSWQMARVAEMVQPALLTDDFALGLFGLDTTPAAATLGCLSSSDYDNTIRLLEAINLIEAGQGSAADVVNSGVLAGAGIGC